MMAGAGGAMRARGGARQPSGFNNCGEGLARVDMGWRQTRRESRRNALRGDAAWTPSLNQPVNLADIQMA